MVFSSTFHQFTNTVNSTIEILNENVSTLFVAVVSGNVNAIVNVSSVSNTNDSNDENTNGNNDGIINTSDNENTNGNDDEDINTSEDGNTKGKDIDIKKPLVVSNKKDDVNTVLFVGVSAGVVVVILVALVFGIIFFKRRYYLINSTSFEIAS